MDVNQWTRDNLGSYAYEAIFHHQTDFFRLLAELVDLSEPEAMINSLLQIAVAKTKNKNMDAIRILLKHNSDMTPLNPGPDYNGPYEKLYLLGLRDEIVKLLNHDTTEKSHD